MLERDYFFEFAGMPKSGKTTIQDIVVHYLKRKGLKVQEYHGGGRYSPIDKNSIASLNLFLAGKAIEFILTCAEREKNQHKIFIMDRGIFDRCIFTSALLRMGKIDRKEASAIETYLTLPRLVKQIDGVFLFVTEPELSLNREYINKILHEKGRVMNTTFLEILRQSSIDCFHSQKTFSNVQLLDTEKFDGKPKHVAQLVIDNILSKIE